LAIEDCAVRAAYVVRSEMLEVGSFP